MEQTLTIRAAERRDLPALGRLGALMVRLHHDFDRARFMAPGPGLEEGYGRFLLAETESKEACVLVAERAGEIVGYVYAGIEPPSWKELRERAGFIHDVVVDEGARGLGAGERLVDAATTWAEEHGAPRLMLWSAAANTRAQRLFERLGFRRTMVEMTRERRPG